MSQEKASNLVSKESLQQKQQWLKDHNIDVPTLESILAERIEREKQNVETK
jgi:hypothetical protein